MISGVDLLTLGSTAIGAALALGGTVMAHVLTSRDRRGRDNRADRRQSYLDFILAVEKAHAGLRRLADPDRSHGDLMLQTREVMADSGIYGAREKVIVTASPPVISAAERTLNGLNDLRRAVRDGAQLNTLPYHERYHRYAEAVWALRQAARADLGSSAIQPEDVGKVSWDSQENCKFCRTALGLSVPTQPA
jgi:hypothetical protein